MTTESMNFETDNEIEVAVTLSNSNRLSLSDITQATIGNLSEWADNSDTASDTGGNVLRPWEDNSDNADYLSKNDNSHQEITKPPPPSYQEHIKRHLEDDAEDVRSKRQRIDSSSFNQIPAAINTFYQKNSEMCNDRRITHNSQKHIQSHDAKQLRYTNNQTVARNEQSTLNMNNTNTTVLPTNSPQQRPQSFENRQQQQPTMNIIMPPNQNSNASQQNYVPWMNSPMRINQTKVDKQVQQTYISPAVNQNVQQVQVVADQTSGIHFQQCLVTHQVQTMQPQLFQPFLFPPQNDMDFQSRVLPVFDMPPLQSSLVYTHPQQKMTNSQSNFPLDNRIPNMAMVPKVVQQCEPIVNTSTSNQLMSKVMNTVSNISETKETAFNLKHLQAAIGCEDNKINENYAVKDEPKTPLGKLGSHSTFDSPGMDSRFTESLYNLLGSPPPDSPMSKNPILGDLQALLNRECKKEIIPQSLFGMQESNNETVKKENVFERERNLQDRFSTLQSKNPEEVRQLSSMFRYQSALIETDRFRTLHESQYPGPYKDSVNRHYDKQLHQVMDRVERSIQLLETSNKENQAKKSTKLRPHLSKESIRLMENWYKQNLSHPYPTSHVIEMLAQAGNIGVEQVKKWFANKRNRNSNTRSLTEIAIQKRKLGQMPGQC